MAVVCYCPGYWEELLDFYWFYVLEDVLEKVLVPGKVLMCGVI